jgi:F-type H+-transporting ATPase subunit b
MKRFLGSLGLLAVLLFLVTLPALAQEHEVTPAESSTGYIYRWVNFAIVFGLIVWVCVKFAGPAFRRRADEISQKIAEGARAREAAGRQRSEIRAKLAGLEDEVRKLREQAKRDAQAEAERLQAMARTEAEKIEQAAQAEIEAAGRAARIELKALAARLAIDRAEALLRQEMTPNADAALFHTFVAELERSVN